MSDHHIAGCKRWNVVLCIHMQITLTKVWHYGYVKTWKYAKLLKRIIRLFFIY